MFWDGALFVCYQFNRLGKKPSHMLCCLARKLVRVVLIKKMYVSFCMDMSLHRLT
jgi:hypothetical protein